MDAIAAIYVISLIVGAGFVLISFLLSGVFGGAADSLEASADVAVDAGHPGELHFSPLSPTVICFFLTAFGATGFFLREYTNVPLAAEVLLALIGGLLFAAVVGAIYFKVLHAAQGSTHVRVEEAVGREAEVTVSIPAKGVGQISFILGGRRTGVARAVDDSDIPARSIVRIAKIVGSTYYVERIP